MKIKVNPGRKAFNLINYIFCILIGILCILPVVHVCAISFSSRDAILSGHVGLLPVDFTTNSYEYIMHDKQFFVSYGATFKRCAVGILVNLVMIVLAAYPMAKSDIVFPQRKWFVAFFMGAMCFSGGLIPSYLVVKNTGLMDTIWALVLPNALPISNMILLMNFIRALPESLSEAAYIDGAGHVTTLFRIILPLCLPSLATISLFVLLDHWNAWFDGQIYIRNANLKPLQTYLKSIVIDETKLNLSSSSMLDDLLEKQTQDGFTTAMIFLAMVPVLCVYPFLQKYFAKGIVRGSVKE